jgi:hypothetical protein
LTSTEERVLQTNYFGQQEPRILSRVTALPDDGEDRYHRITAVKLKWSVEMNELTNAELDAVSAGAGQNAGVAQAGLINAGVIAQVTDILNNNNVQVLNNNHTDVAVAILGVAGA